MLLSDIIDQIEMSNVKQSVVNVVMKMDIEGNECRAIMGSQSVFGKGNSVDIPIIIMEWR